MLPGCAHAPPPDRIDEADAVCTPVGKGDENEEARGVGSPAEAPDGDQEPPAEVAVGAITFCDAVGKGVVEAIRFGTLCRLGPEGRPSVVLP